MEDKLTEALTTIGAIVEISRFVYTQMIRHGFTKAQSFQTAQKIILQALPSTKSREEQEDDR